VKDIEYLKEAISKGYLCPKCRQDFLRFEEGVGAVCCICGEDFPSWVSLFLITARYMGWGVPEQAWRKWLEAHPNYVE